MLIQGVLSRSGRRTLPFDVRESSVNIFERIPYIGFASDTSSGSFDYAPIIHKTNQRHRGASLRMTAFGDFSINNLEPVPRSGFSLIAENVPTVPEFPKRQLGFRPVGGP